jgi:hypothetical protein
MKLKITFLTLAAAALTASAAFAAPPAGKGKPTTSPSSSHPATPTVMFVVHGTITSYVAVNGTTPGSIVLNVTGTNHAAASLNGKPLTLAVSTTTKIVGTPTATHRATLKWRGTKASVSSLTSASTISQLIDQGASS